MALDTRPDDATDYQSGGQWDSSSFSNKIPFLRFLVALLLQVFLASFRVEERDTC